MSSDKPNQPGFWCPEGTVGLKAPNDYSYSSFGSLSKDGKTFTLGTDANPGAEGNQAFVKVVVKAGAGQSTDGNVNTVFAEPPVAGETVWADSNPDNVFGTGDKEISHIIFCAGTTSVPEEGSVEAEKKWTVTGLDPSTAPGFTAGTPGTLTFNGETKPWTNNTTAYAVGTNVKVMEAGDGTPPTATGYKCTIDTTATTYTVGDTTSTTPPTVTVKANTTIKVTVTNTANCTKDIPPPPPPPEEGSVEAEKKWTVTGLDPSTAPGFTAGTPGTLTFNGETKPWTNNTTAYAVGTNVKVMEAGDGTPPTATGYKCTIDTTATTYTVGDTTSTTPPTVTVKANTTIKVTVTNTANCTKDIPPPPPPPEEGSVER